MPLCHVGMLPRIVPDAMRAWWPKGLPGGSEATWQFLICCCLQTPMPSNLIESNKNCPKINVTERECFWLFCDVLKMHADYRCCWMPAPLCQYLHAGKIFKRRLPLMLDASSSVPESACKQCIENADNRWCWTTAPLCQYLHAGTFCLHPTARIATICRKY